MSRGGSPASSSLSLLFKGAPLVLLCVAGLSGLSQFQAGRYASLDARVSRSSERGDKLKAAHADIARQLALGDTPLVLKPVPRPRGEAGEGEVAPAQQRAAAR